MAGKVRVGALLGILVVFAPPAVVPLERVGERMLSVSRGVDTIERLRGGEGLTVNGDPSDSGLWEHGSESAETMALRTAIDEALDRQESALFAGDRAAFTELADRGDAALVDGLARRFDSLRAMRVAIWEESIEGPLSVGRDGTVGAAIRMRYCFVVPQCSPVEATVATRWSVLGGQARVTELGTSPPSRLGPRPWEVSALKAVVGQRVIVAGTEKWESRLRSVLTIAERAAAIVDRYSRWTTGPSRYVVYVAGPEEWVKWYGVRQANWVAAYAMPLDDQCTEIVLNALKVGSTDVRDVLQHEFTHVVTLSGRIRTAPNSWWLVEGIAEYVQNVGAPMSEYRAINDGRRYASSPAWSGSVALGEPDVKATASEANGRYAVAFLAVRRLVERFGEPRMLELFNAVVRQGQGLEAASSAVLGLPWIQVSDDLARYVRKSLGA